MISVDRTSNVAVHEQLVEQLRYLIASGHFKIEQTLPSTRTLARQVGVSFHTVRKAYQQLDQEGVLEARVGSGYRVKERTPLEKSERMERGAMIVQEALQRLIGIGLEESELEYLFQEQFDLLATPSERHKLLFTAPYREMAVLCAEQVALALQLNIEPVTLDDLARHHDADYVLTPFTEIRQVMTLLPHADVLGVVTYLPPDVLEKVARLLAHQTLGLVTHDRDAPRPLMAALRTQAGFSGQAMATSIDADAHHLRQFIEEADLLVYTPSCRRRLLKMLDQPRKHVAATPVVSRDSLERLRQVVPMT